MLRICKVCQSIKSIEDFRKHGQPKHGKPKHGRRHICKACQSQQKSIYNQTRRKENNLTHQAYRLAHPEKRRKETARYRVKYREELQRREQLRRTLHAVEIRLRRMLVPLVQRRAWGKKWREANRERHRELSSRHRAAKANAPLIEKIDREVIYARDKWVCQLCFSKVKTRKEASLDHVIPLSKNGNHTAQNLVLVHNKCNARKRDRTVLQQMRLFG